MKKILLICPVCKKEFEKVQSYVNRDRKKNSSRKFHCSKKCAHNGAMKKIKIFCKNCKKEMLKTPSEIKKGAVFCSHSCSCIFSNKHRPKKPKKCKKCGDLYIYKFSVNSLNLCNKCYLIFNNKSDYYKELTIKEYMNTGNGKLPSYRFHRIRQFGKSWSSDRPKKCQYCGYILHIEYCHIIHISKFPKDTKLWVVNNPDNILILCPNHHWEFDNGYLVMENKELKSFYPDKVS